MKNSTWLKNYDKSGNVEHHSITIGYPLVLFGNYISNVLVASSVNDFWFVFWKWIPAETDLPSCLSPLQIISVTWARPCLSGSRKQLGTILNLHKIYWIQFQIFDYKLIKGAKVTEDNQWSAELVAFPTLLTECLKTWVILEILQINYEQMPQKIACGTDFRMIENKGGSS